MLPDKHPARLALALLLVVLAGAAWLASQRPSAAPEDFGYRPDPEGVKGFLDELGPERYFAQAAPDAVAKAREIDVFLYRQMDRAHRARYGKPFVVGRQGIGDCVSWGAMHAVFCAEAVDWDLGKRSEPPLLPATEAIYGGARVEARGKPGDGINPVGGYSDGATGWGAAKFLKDWGVVYRQAYESADLREYSADRAKEYGAFGCGGRGDRGRLDAIARKTPCRHVVAVRTWDELVGAIESGFPVTIASSVGFNSTRDSDGFCVADRTWMHQMCVIGIRFAKNAPAGSTRPRDGALILNSWGPNYVGGPKYPADQPDGSFWCDRPSIERILAQGDSYAIGESKFEFRDLDNGGWLAPGPIESLSSR